MTRRDDSREAFLARWSRLKQETRQRPPEKAPSPAPQKEPADLEAPPPELPPLDKLAFDSDYRAFFHPKVDEDVRRAALKKLFGDPHFNIMDGLDVYIDDYSKPDPIPAAMLARLEQARNILEWAKQGDRTETKDAGAGPGEVAAAKPAALEGGAAFSTPPARTAEPPSESHPPAPDAVQKTPWAKSPEDLI